MQTKGSSIVRIIGGLSATLLVLSAFLPWAEGFQSAHKGIEYWQGYLTLIAGLVAVAVVVLQPRQALGRARVSVLWLVGALAAVSVVSFWVATIGSIDHEATRTLIEFFNTPRLDAGIGLAFAAVGAGGVLCAAMGGTIAEGREGL